IGSFRLTGRITITERHIKLPRLGKLRLKERSYLPTSGVHILSATLREQAGHWFVSVQVQKPAPVVEPATGDPVGIDLAIRAMATCDDGQVFSTPKALRRHLTRLKRLQRRVSRKVKGGNNRRKARLHLARQHRRVACIRQNALHQATSTL